MSRRRTIKAEPGYGLTPTGGKQLLDKTYLGFVKDNRDAFKMGRLRVWIPEISSDPTEESSWITANYMSPFAGASLVNENLIDGEQFQHTQKSYGWWFIPPDLENEVIIMFINGDPQRGIWIGCLYGQLMNHMIPGIASGKTFSDDIEQNIVPVAEYNKKSKVPVNNPTRPTHDPLKLGLDRQGLQGDLVRGQTSSSARRESPSRVNGILTPRGTQFVMDDGFTNREAEEERTTGFGVTFDKNTNPVHRVDATARNRTGVHFRESEFIRMRTRSGAQVLISETDGMIYFISRDGNSWIEIGPEGHVDIYGAMDISIRSEASVNIRADKDVNIEAGRDVNIKATKDFREKPRDEGDIISPGSGDEGGNILLESVVDTHIKSGDNIFIRSDNTYHLDVGTSAKVETGSDYDRLIGGATRLSTGASYDRTVGSSTTLSTGTTHDEIIGDQRTVRIGQDDYRKVERTTFDWIKKGADVQGFCPVDDPVEIDCDQDPQGTIGAQPATAAKTRQTQCVNDKEFVTTGLYHIVETETIVERLPQHEPYADHVAGVVGTRNLVTENLPISDLGLKEGSITSDAKIPLPVTGTVNGVPGQHKGVGYTDKGKPIYERIGDADQAPVCDMEVSERGIDKLIQREGKVLTPYNDSAGLPTIGYGHLLTESEKASGTINIGDESVPFNSGLDEEQARSLLKQDSEKAHKDLCRLVAVPLSQNQYDAIHSWIYNVGGGRSVAKSTLMAKLNTGNYAAVPSEMQRWNKSGRPPKVDNGLSNRRQAEALDFTRTGGTTRIA